MDAEKTQEKVTGRKNVAGPEAQGVDFGAAHIPNFPPSFSSIINTATDLAAIIIMKLTPLVFAVALWSCPSGLTRAAVLPPSAHFSTPLTLTNLDADAFIIQVDGAEKPVPVRDGPRHVVWTQESAPEWDGVSFGDSKTPGPRHLRLAWKTPLPVGTVLVRAGGQLSVLKPAAAYPGRLDQDADWLPATRIKAGAVSTAELAREDGQWPLGTEVAEVDGERVGVLGAQFGRDLGMLCGHVFRFGRVVLDVVEFGRAGPGDELPPVVPVAVTGCAVATLLQKGVPV